MLSEQSRPVVEATLPVVGAHVGEIASRFYRHLFAEHPELLDGVFDRGNQARGEQQRSLAGSVATFATALVETPERTPGEPVAADRAQARLPGHPAGPYQVVHDHLMWAIVDSPRRRGDPQVAAAWDEVYWLRADQPGAGPLQCSRCTTGNRLAAVARGEVAGWRRLQPAARSSGHRRHPDLVAALRRCRPRRLRAADGVRQRGHRHRADGGHAVHLAAGSGLSITLLHADRDEASFPLRRQVVTDVLDIAQRVTARLVRAGRGDDRGARRRPRGRHGSLGRRAPRRCALLLCWSAALHAGHPRPDCWNGVSLHTTSSTRCSGPTFGRPIWT